MGDLPGVAYALAVVALLLGYTIGKLQDIVIDWLHDMLGLAVSGLVYVLVLAGVIGIGYGALVAFDVL